MAKSFVAFFGGADSRPAVLRRRPSGGAARRTNLAQFFSFGNAEANQILDAAEQGFRALLSALFATL
jgi:hypothetical protein